MVSGTIHPLLILNVLESNFEPLRGILDAEDTRIRVSIGGIQYLLGTSYLILPPNRSRCTV